MWRTSWAYGGAIGFGLRAAIRDAASPRLCRAGTLTILKTGPEYGHRGVLHTSRSGLERNVHAEIE
jgi:hypothetical protein